MRILLLKVTLRASWVKSLKEKRMILLSVTKRLKNKFNVSVGEVGSQDSHKIIEIGISQYRSRAYRYTRGNNGLLIYITKKWFMNKLKL